MSDGDSPGPIRQLPAGLGVENHRLVLITHPPEFDPADEMTEAHLDANDTRRAALRILVGEETRSMAEVAKELGVSKQAVSKALATIGRRCGFSRHFWSEDARIGASLAAIKAHRRRRQKKQPVLSDTGRLENPASTQDAPSTGGIAS